jgi:hypothetical protein
MLAADIIDEPVRINASEAPTVDRWDTDDEGALYIVRLGQVSIRLTEAQVRALGSRILSATLDELEDGDPA